MPKKINCSDNSDFSILFKNLESNCFLIAFPYFPKYVKCISLESTSLSFILVISKQENGKIRTSSSTGCLENSFIEEIERQFISIFSSLISSIIYNAKKLSFLLFILFFSLSRNPSETVCFDNICLKCQNDFKLFEDTNICQTEAPSNNYYFDENYNIYRRCHEFCKSCSQGPKNYSNVLEIEDTNCNECIDDYYKMENTSNCINKKISVCVMLF